MEAGLPEGVVNFLPGSGALIGKIALSSKDFGGLHLPVRILHLMRYGKSRRKPCHIQVLSKTSR